MKESNSQKAFIFGSNAKGLKYTSRDIKIISHALLKHGYQINTLFNENKNSVISSLDNLIDSCDQLDTIIVYFSGHGIIKNGKLYLILGEDYQLNSQIIDSDILLSSLELCRSQQKLVILDCCHAGLSTKKWKPDPSDHYRILTASGKLEKAKELEVLKNSYLTYQLTRLLVEDNNLAQLVNDNPTNNVYINKLFDRLVEITREYNFNNKLTIPTPCLYGNSGLDIEICNIKKENILSLYSDCFISKGKDKLWGTPFISDGDILSSDDIIKKVEKSASGNFFYIEGLAGSGKTTFLEFANQKLALKTDFIFFIRLEEYFSLLLKEKSLSDILMSEFPNKNNYKKAILIVDSLDEVLNNYPEFKVHKWIKKFISLGGKFKSTIFSCRSETLVSTYIRKSIKIERSNKVQFNIFEIMPLTDKYKESAINYCQNEKRNHDCLNILKSAEKLNLKSFGDLKILTSIYDYDASSTIRLNHEGEVIVELLLIILSKIRPISKDLSTENQLYRLGYLAYFIRSGCSAYDSKSIYSDIDNTQEYLSWLKELNRAGILRINSSISFVSDRFSDAAISYSFIIDILNLRNIFNSKTNSYFSAKSYEYASQLINAWEIDSEIIKKARELGGKEEFSLAKTYCHSNNMPIELIKNWLLQSWYIRVKQRLAHCLYVHGEHESYVNFILSVLPSAKEDDHVPLDHSLIIHELITHEMDDKTIKIIMDCYMKKPILRRYLVSHIASAQYYPAADIFIDSLTWADLKGRDRRYVVASLGYLGQKGHIQALQNLILSENSEIYKADMSRAIEMIQIRNS